MTYGVMRPTIRYSYHPAIPTRNEDHNNCDPFYVGRMHQFKWKENQNQNQSSSFTQAIYYIYYVTIWTYKYNIHMHVSAK